MTAIYTQPDTGKKFERKLQGVYHGGNPAHMADQGAGACTLCAFGAMSRNPDECLDAPPCTYFHTSSLNGPVVKAVQLYFKEIPCSAA